MDWLFQTGLLKKTFSGVINLPPSCREMFEWMLFQRRIKKKNSRLIESWFLSVSFKKIWKTSQNHFRRKCHFISNHFRQFLFFSQFLSRLLQHGVIEDCHFQSFYLFLYKMEVVICKKWKPSFLWNKAK